MDASFANEYFSLDNVLVYHDSLLFFRDFLFLTHLLSISVKLVKIMTLTY